jgi:cystathionine beta-lyase/cystathionine gamma-synthase
MKSKLTRRRFLSATAVGVASSPLVSRSTARANSLSEDKLALLGGPKTRTTPVTSWPILHDLEEKELLKVLHSKRWNRLGGSEVDRFEKVRAERLSAHHCIATSSGTSALVTALNALDVGPGDEVIVPPYTFVATINVVLLQHALPVFVDTDRATSQMDASKIEAAITKRTLRHSQDSKAGDLVGAVLKRFQVQCLRVATDS